MEGASTNYKDTVVAAASSASGGDGTHLRLVQIKRFGMWMESSLMDLSSAIGSTKELPDWNTESH